MARARVKQGHRSTEIADAIIAEWYRTLPPRGVSGQLPMDANALTAAFSEIVDARCEAVLDIAGHPLKIVVPLPPANVTSREDLIDYLRKNDDFRQGMGAAVLFGCGR